MRWAECVHVVLVEPESPGNIGAAARALKTMGLRQLVLVRPACDPQAAEARRLAHNAEDVLGAATRADSLTEALANCVLAIGTTQRSRTATRATETPRQAAARVLPLADAGCPVALVFGRESSGLTNHELALCTHLSSIPAATTVPSLNLAQAVMVYCAALFEVAEGEAGLAGSPLVTQIDPSRPATAEQMEHFYAHLGRTLLSLGARPAVDLDRFVDKYRRVFNRVPLEERDVMLLHKLLEAADRYVREHPAADQRDH